MNNTSRQTLSYITFCIYVCPYVYLLKFLLNHLFSYCFEITITLGGSGPHATSHIHGAASYSPVLWLYHLSSDGLEESDCKHKAAPSTENIPVSRGELIELSTITHCNISFVRLQSHILPCSFGGTPECFEIPCRDIRYRVAHACGSRCTRVSEHRALLWFTESIRFLMWILSIAISIIDLKVRRWSTTKLM